MCTSTLRSVLALDHAQTVVTIFSELWMTKGTDIGLGFRPLAESKIVQLALKTCIVGVLEVLRKNNISDCSHIEDLNRQAIDGPRYYRWVFALQNLIQVTQELRYTDFTVSGLGSLFTAFWRSTAASTAHINQFLLYSHIAAKSQMCCFAWRKLYIHVHKDRQKISNDNPLPYKNEVIFSWPRNGFRFPKKWNPFLNNNNTNEERCHYFPYIISSNSTQTSQSPLG